MGGRPADAGFLRCRDAALVQRRSSTKVPVMSWPEIIALAVLPAFLLLDLLKPAARGDGRARWWRSRAFAVTAFNFWLAMKIGELWAAHLGDVHLFDGAALGTVGGAVVGVLVYEFFHYAYHRTVHRFDCALAARPPDAPQPREPRRLGRLLPASDRRGAVHHAVEPGAVPAARPERRGRRLGGGDAHLPGRVPACRHAHAALARLRRAAARKATPSITSAASMRTTTPTCRSGTCCSAPSATRRPAPSRRRASTTAPRRGSREMLAFRDVSRKARALRSRS